MSALDFHACAVRADLPQLLAWLGADVIKVERPGVGTSRADRFATSRMSTASIHDDDHTKLSIALDAKHPEGKELLEALVKVCDVLSRISPCALDRMGFGWSDQDTESAPHPRLDQGFGPGPTTYEDAKIYDNAAQCTGGLASTTVFRDGPPMVTAAQIGGRRHRVDLAIGILAALYSASAPPPQYVSAPMQTGC